MSESKSHASGGGIGFFGALAILFIALKLCGVIHWSWVWVLWPLWLPITILFAILLLVFIVYVVATLVVIIFDWLVSLVK